MPSSFQFQTTNTRTNMSMNRRSSWRVLPEFLEPPCYIGVDDTGDVGAGEVGKLPSGHLNLLLPDIPNQMTPAWFSPAESAPSTRLV
jgi:hypothetical protein